MSEKADWELAWRARYKRDSRTIASSFELGIEDARVRRIEQKRSAFREGYLAAKSEQEAAIRAAKRKVLEELNALAPKEYLEQLPPGERTNTQKLAVAATAFRASIDELLAKYTDPTEKSE